MNYCESYENSSHGERYFQFVHFHKKMDHSVVLSDFCRRLSTILLTYPQVCCKLPLRTLTALRFYMQDYTPNLAKGFYTRFQRKLVKTSSNNFDYIDKFQGTQQMFRYFIKGLSSHQLCGNRRWSRGQNLHLFPEESLQSDFRHISAYWRILTTETCKVYLSQLLYWVWVSRFWRQLG